jgi:hypothetical protein
VRCVDIDATATAPSLKLPRRFGRSGSCDVTELDVPGNRRDRRVRSARRARRSHSPSSPGARRAPCRGGRHRRRAHGDLPSSPSTGVGRATREVEVRAVGTSDPALEVAAEVIWMAPAEAVLCSIRMTCSPRRSSMATRSRQRHPGRDGRRFDGRRRSSAVVPTTAREPHLQETSPGVSNTCTVLT